MVIKTNSGPSDPFSFFWVGVEGQDNIVIGFEVLVLSDETVHFGMTLVSPGCPLEVADAAGSFLKPRSGLCVRKR